MGIFIYLFLLGPVLMVFTYFYLEILRDDKNAKPQVPAPLQRYAVKHTDTCMVCCWEGECKDRVGSSERCIADLWRVDKRATGPLPDHLSTIHEARWDEGESSANKAVYERQTGSYVAEEMGDILWRSDKMVAITVDNAAIWM